MTKIESRPMKKELGKYVFFIDIDGNIDDASIYFAPDKVRQNTFFYKFRIIQLLKCEILKKEVFENFLFSLNL